jgi:hypothetical protein
MMALDDFLLELGLPALFFSLGLSPVVVVVVDEVATLTALGVLATVAVAESDDLTMVARDVEKKRRKRLYIMQ